MIIFLLSKKMTTLPDLLSIMCFTWNAEGLRICETSSKKNADKKRKTFFGKKKSCIAPNFFFSISQYINSKKPDLVVMCTQEEDESDTYFHSEFLPHNLGDIDYEQVAREKLGKVGNVASGGKYPNRDPKGSAIRMSIYAREPILDKIFIVDEKSDTFALPPQDSALSICKQDKRKSGALVTYLEYRSNSATKIAFISAIIPSQDDLFDIKLNPNEYKDLNESTNNIFLFRMFDKFITQLVDAEKPNHIFLIGDLNYNIDLDGQTVADIIGYIDNGTFNQELEGSGEKLLYPRDGLVDALTKAPLIGFGEGVLGEGPRFAPTSSLKVDRAEECDVQGKVPKTCFNDQKIGWRDRILYKNVSIGGTKPANVVFCTSYYRIDTANMHKSTHAGVVGYFRITPQSNIDTDPYIYNSQIKDTRIVQEKLVENKIAELKKMMDPGYRKSLEDKKVIEDLKNKISVGMSKAVKKPDNVAIDGFVNFYRNLHDKIKIHPYPQANKEDVLIAILKDLDDEINTKSGTNRERLFDLRNRLSNLELDHQKIEVSKLKDRISYLINRTGKSPAVKAMLVDLLAELNITDYDTIQLTKEQQGMINDLKSELFAQMPKYTTINQISNNLIASWPEAPGSGTIKIKRGQIPPALPPKNPSLGTRIAGVFGNKT